MNESPESPCPPATESTAQEFETDRVAGLRGLELANVII
jgi:hypothetical protein